MSVKRLKYASNENRRETVPRATASRGHPLVQPVPCDGPGGAPHGVAPGSAPANLACSLIVNLNDADGALDMLAPYFKQASWGQIRHAEVDPDMDSLRDDKRFRAVVVAAGVRLGTSPE